MQRGASKLRIAEQRHFGGVVGADDGRIHVEVDYLDRARRRVAPALGRDRPGAAAGEYHQVGAVHFMYVAFG